MNLHGIQWDSTDPLPFKPPLQALYANGRFRSPLHYGRGKVFIDVTGGLPNGAHWLDVEKGDATPADVPGWLDERRKVTGDTGGIYCDRATLEAVEHAAGDRPHQLWVATLDGTVDVAVPGGAGHLVAVQAVPAGMLGFNADMSVVVDAGYWAQHAVGAG
jgi:hypothetical protein